MKTHLLGSTAKNFLESDASSKRFTNCGFTESKITESSHCGESSKDTKMREKRKLVTRTLQSAYYSGC